MIEIVYASIERFFLDTGELFHKIVGSNTRLGINVDLDSHEISFEGWN